MKIEDRREALIRAALVVMAERGVAAATTRAVVATAGMPLASFHYAFASHEEMIGYVIRSVVDEQGPSGAGERGELAVIEQETDPVALFEAVLNRHLDLVIADPGRQASLLELSLHAVRSAALTGLAARQYEASLARIRELLATTARFADFEYTVDLDTLARLVLSVTDGIALQWLTQRDTPACRAALHTAAQSLASHVSVPAKPVA